MIRCSVTAILALASIAVLAALQSGSDQAVASAGATSTTNPLTPPPPENLQVSGGEDRWHSDNGFRLDWTIPRSWKQRVTAVHFQIRNEARAVVVPETSIGWAAEVVESLWVPGPGTHTAEVWLETGGGGEGLAATAKLRFDDTRPAAVEPLPATGWVGRAGLPYTVRVSHPVDPLPPSGIRGYAVSVDSTPGGNPCAAIDRCGDDETDLRGGIEGDSLPLAGLPEGTSYIHAVAVSGAGMKSTMAGSAVIHVDTTDPATILAGAPRGWTNHPVTVRAMATDAMSGMEAAGATGPFTAIRVDAGAPAIAAGGSAATTVIGEGTHTIAFYARDAAGNVNDGAGGNPPPATASLRIDRSPPAAAFLSAQSPDDPELIEVRVADSLSGPDLSRGRIEMRRSGSGEAFEPLPTEAGGGELRARWNSDSYPAGEYEFRAAGYDLAGNSVLAYKRVNGASMVLPNPLKAPTKIETGFGGKVLIWQHCVRHGERRRCRRQTVPGFDRRPPLRYVPYGGSTLFGGRLIAGLGSPLAQMPVQVTERFDPGSGRPDRVTTVKTGAGGIFVSRLAPGPSRQVSAAFAGTRTLTHSGGRPVRLGVRTGIRMRPSAAVAKIGGRPIVFGGGIESEAAIPAGGKSVQLQFRLPGLPWSEFRTIQSDENGHFRYAYRFSDDDSRGVRFEFRAFVPAQGDWPYEPAASPPVAVRGR